MKFEPLNIEKHDLGKVSKLIYETELEIFRPILGKDENEAIYNIERLIIAGNNSFSDEHIHVVTDDTDHTLGILVSFCGRQTSLWHDFKAYSKVLNFIGLLKFIVKGIAVNEFLTANVGPNDYYLSNIAVDPEFRGRGIGSYILKNALRLAEDAGCPRVILDVTFDNEGALRFYEKFGFRIYGRKSNEWIFKDQGTLNLELLINK